MLRTALMLPLSVARPKATATSRARTSASPTSAKYSRICSVSLPYVRSVPALGRVAARAGPGTRRRAALPVVSRAVSGPASEAGAAEGTP